MGLLTIEIKRRDTDYDGRNAAFTTCIIGVIDSYNYLPSKQIGATLLSNRCQAVLLFSIEAHLQLAFYGVNEGEAYWIKAFESFGFRPRDGIFQITSYEITGGKIRCNIG
jgi:hypothetical protein